MSVDVRPPAVAALSVLRCFRMCSIAALTSCMFLQNRFCITILTNSL